MFFLDFHYFLRASGLTGYFLIKLLGVSHDLRLLELWYLIYPRVLTGFSLLVFFTNSSLMKFQVGFLALLYLVNGTDNIFPVKTGILVFRKLPQIFPGIFFCCLRSEKLFSDLVKHSIEKYPYNFIYIIVFDVETALENANYRF